MTDAGSGRRVVRGAPASYLLLVQNGEMRRRRLRLATLVIALAVTPAVALGALTTGAANSKTFQDATGEDPEAPDITTVAVSNDDTGLVTFKIAVANRPSLTPDMVFLIFLDTVPNAGDADSLGADYALQLVTGSAALFKWSGSDFEAAPSQASVSFTYEPSGPEIRVRAGELGSPKAFQFVVLAVSGVTEDASGDPDFTNAHDDFAPDAGGGLYAYDVLTTVTLKAVGFTTSPKPARAGKTFSVGLAATQSTTSRLVTGGTVVCTATVGGQGLRLKAKRIRNGVATCVWAIPKNAKGKTVRGSITLLVEGAQLKRSFSAKIR